MGNRLAGMKGGGFLNNVDATLLNYEFTNVFPGTEAPDPDDPQLFAVLTFQEDGKADPVETTLRGGSLRFLEIVDQHTVSNPEGNPARIWDKSDLYHFLGSVEAGGVVDGGIDDSDLDKLSFTSLIGRRFRLVQEADEARMKARALAGQNPKRVVTKNGVDKEYDYTRLIAESVYEGAPKPTPTVAARGAAGTANSGSRKAMPASTQRSGASSRPTRPAVAKTQAAKSPAGTTAGVFDLDTESARVLSEILEANKGSIQRSQIAMLVTKGYTSHPQRESLRKRIFSEDFLATEQGWNFDQPSQVISLG